MREKATLIGFLLILAGSLAFQLPILLALLIGWCLFMLYGYISGQSVGSLISMSLAGIAKIKTILLTFMLIGMMTGAWRIAGTVPYIAYVSVPLITPGLFYLAAFLLCCFISTLMGTSFGSAATMGLISMTVCVSMGLDTTLTGGAILSGAYVGDRWSPMSTSALLVATLTDTDIYANIRAMVKTALVPFVIACALYALPGLNVGRAAVPAANAAALFQAHFVLHPIAFLPAAAIILLSLLKIRVRLSMLVSILVSVPIALFVQGQRMDAILHTLVFGYASDNDQLARMLNGGGLVSMLRTSAIVCLSATYSGLFEGTGLLNNLKSTVEKLSKKTTPYFGVLSASLFYSLIGFNQTLPVMLTHQLCRDVMPDREKLAVTLENTAILIPPLVPWSIAGSVPLFTVGAGLSSIPYAFFLYLVPIWCLIADTAKQKIK